MAYVDWSLQGHSIANCNCDFGCPCQFNTLPTHGDCRAMTAVKIDNGHFGDVDLSGLAFCGMFAWPGAIHFGNGEAFVVISDHANEAQRNALLTILSGKETVAERTKDGIAAARARGKHPGRRPLDADKIAAALSLVKAGLSPTAAAKQLGLGRSTVYREVSRAGVERAAQSA